MILEKILFLLFAIPMALSISNPRIMSEKGAYSNIAGNFKRSIADSDHNKQTAIVSQTIPSFFATKKPKSLDGWLSSPKNDSENHNISENLTITDLVKDGFCGNTQNYGIRCGKRMDQCKWDANCPGVTKCCLVSDCGFMCVKPKAKLKHQVIQKKKSTKDKKEVVTTAEGLKVEDITSMPESNTTKEPEVDVTDPSVEDITNVPDESVTDIPEMESDTEIPEDEKEDIKEMVESESVTNMHELNITNLPKIVSILKMFEIEKGTNEPDEDKAKSLEEKNTKVLIDVI